MNIVLKSRLSTEFRLETFKLKSQKTTCEYNYKKTTSNPETKLPKQNFFHTYFFSFLCKYRATKNMNQTWQNARLYRRPQDGSSDQKDTKMRRR